ncbi:MAG: hypothetical protein JW934_15470 [Anaerolineae bacterium]|nr:hypothetical protein [Anaerolineae bacterium]
MPPAPIDRNTLFYGDNLPILREYVPDESIAAGFYHSPGWGQDYPRLQILSIEALLTGAARPDGAAIQMPSAERGTFK